MCACASLSACSPADRACVLLNFLLPCAFSARRRWPRAQSICKCDLSLSIFGDTHRRPWCARPNRPLPRWPRETLWARSSESELLKLQVLRRRLTLPRYCWLNHPIMCRKKLKRFAGLHTPRAMAGLLLWSVVQTVPVRVSLRTRPTL
jgi:hypothetical protein